MVSQSLLPHGLVHTFGDGVGGSGNGGSGCGGGAGGRGEGEAAVQHPAQLHPKVVRASQEKLTAREAQSPSPQGVEHTE